MSSKLNRVVRVMSERLTRLGIAKHPGLLFRPKQEGYLDFAFGGRAGPQIACMHLFHELAHAAEFGGAELDRRASVRGFAFYVPQRWVFNRYCAEPVSMQATERELRTFAIQYRLLQRAGYRLASERFVEEASSSLCFMHDWFHVPGDSDEAREAYCKGRILALIEETDARDALERLEDWLARTRAKLAELHRAGKTLFLQATCFRGDGSVYNPA